MTKQILLSISFLFGWTACSNQSIDLPSYLEDLDNLIVYPSDKELDYSVELIKETTYGDTDEVFLGRFGTSAVDEKGRVYIGDFDANAVVVYNEDGSFLQYLGREGGGPGEFRSLWHMEIRDTMLHVYDYVQQRMNVFSTQTFEFEYTVSLQFEEERNTDLSIWRSETFYLLDDGYYLMQFTPSFFETEDQDRTQRLYIVSKDGRISSDLILELPWGREFLTDKDELTYIWVPYARKTLLAISEDTIYSLWTEDLTVKAHDLDGSYRNAFYHPIQKIDLDGQEILQSEQYEHPRDQRIIRDSGFPKTWPAVRDFILDDENRFWISTLSKDLDVVEWLILKENGELITRFTWPENRSIWHVKNGNIYAYETDEDTGIVDLVRYSFGITPD